jgi:hypothetical protein
MCDSTTRASQSRKVPAILALARPADTRPLYFIREALAAPSRPGVRGIAKRFGVNPGTMQRINRLSPKA